MSIELKSSRKDAGVRELKRILLAAWSPERLPELDAPETDTADDDDDDDGCIDEDFFRGLCSCIRLFYYS